MSDKVLALLLLFPSLAFPTDAPDVKSIIQKSVEANHADWEVAPQYSFWERDRDGKGTKTYEVHMIAGSPYQKLVAVNGKPISPEEQAKEQKKLEAEIEKRKNESAHERQRRVANYEKERKRDQMMLDQLTEAFNFQFAGEQRLGAFNVWVLRAVPRPGYKPPSMQTQVLTGMNGRLWIDKKTFQWVRVEAQVVKPVNIEGFLAQVQPGTRFELEKMPVGDGHWMPKHFVMRSQAKVLRLFNRRDQADETYFNYRKSQE